MPCYALNYGCHCNALPCLAWPGTVLQPTPTTSLSSQPQRKTQLHWLTGLLKLGRIVAACLGELRACPHPHTLASLQYYALYVWSTHAQTQQRTAALYSNVLQLYIACTRTDTATYCSFIQRVHPQIQQRTAALYSVYTHRYSNVLQLYIAQIQQRTAALYSIYACVHTCVLRSPMFCSGKYPEVGKITTQEAPTTTPPDTTAHRVVAQLQALLQEEDMVTVASTAGASRYSAVFCCILSYTTLLYNHAWCSAQTLIYRQGSIDKCRPFHTVASIPLTWLLRCGCLQQRAGCWDFPVVSASWQYDR